MSACGASCARIENIAEQDITPEQWLAELPDYMRKRVNDHMEKARPWLERLFTLWGQVGIK